MSEVLAILQEKYQFQFSYADDVIKDISVKLPPANFTINQTINYLKKETNLIFQFLDDRFISITAKNITYIICGYIIDQETRQPLEAVTIVGKSDQTISDSYGYFQLKIKQANQSISIRHLGFQSVAELATFFNDNSCPNIYLKPQIESLSEITLSNFIAKGIDKVVDGTFNINFSNFGILPGQIENDVLQTVQYLPGIQSANETVSDINIRGGTNDQNLILWDGIKMYQSGHFFGLISIFNPQMTREATVIKNGSDAQYSDGVSGTIAMRTDDNITKSASGNIGVNFINLDGFVDAPLGKNSSFQLSGRKAINEFVKELPTYVEYFERISRDTEVETNTNTEKSFDFYDISMRWLYQITDNDFLKFSGLLVDNELIFNENDSIGQVQESKQSSIKQNTIAGGLLYRKNWNDSFVSILNITESRYNLDAINADIFNQQTLEQKNEVSETSIKLNTIFKYNDQITLLNGYQYTDTGITNFTEVDNPVFKLAVTEVVSEHGLYSQINYASILKTTYIKGGVRYNFIEKLKKHIVEPRLSLYHNLSKHLSIEILAEMKHQNSSQIITGINDFLGIERRRWQLSNKDSILIPVLRSKQVSLGLNFNKKGLLLNAEAYYKNVNEITARSQGFLNQYAFAKTSGAYDVKGIDFLINKRFKKFSSWLSYSFTDNDYTFKELSQIKFPNNLDIRHSLNFGSSYTTNQFKMSVGVNWHTGKPTTGIIVENPITDNEINYAPANSSRLKDYFRIDASAIYNFNISHNIKANTGISILNITNQENIISNYYIINENNEPENINNKALNITPNFTFRVLF